MNFWWYMSYSILPMLLGFVIVTPIALILYLIRWWNEKNDC